MSKRVIILSGVSGSGKSTVIKTLWPASARVAHCSADHYFSYDADGAYRFDASKLADAHNACLIEFMDAVIGSAHDTIVVDNTNTTIEEIAPYYAIAQAYGFDVTLVNVCCTIAKAAARNEHDHGYGVPSVSYLGVCGQERRLTTRRIPSFWKLRMAEVYTDRVWDIDNEKRRTVVVDNMRGTEIGPSHWLVTGEGGNKRT